MFKTFNLPKALLCLIAGSVITGEFVAMDELMRQLQPVIRAVGPENFGALVVVIPQALITGLVSGPLAAGRTIAVSAAGLLSQRTTCRFMPERFNIPETRVIIPIVASTVACNVMHFGFIRATEGHDALVRELTKTLWRCKIGAAVGFCICVLIIPAMGITSRMHRRQFRAPIIPLVPRQAPQLAELTEPNLVVVLITVVPAANLPEKCGICMDEPRNPVRMCNCQRNGFPTDLHALCAGCASGLSH